jgi:hypothetical protein
MLFVEIVQLIELQPQPDPTGMNSSAVMRTSESHGRGAS